MVGPSASLRKVEERSFVYITRSFGLFLNQEDRIPEGTRSMNVTLRNPDISGIDKEDETSRFDEVSFKIAMHWDLIEGDVTS